MTTQYILNDEGIPVPEPDLLKWGSWFQNTERHVADERIGKSRISTVFLGIDHGFDPARSPLLWETMVFGGDLDGDQDRCGGSKEDAMEMHIHMVKKVRATEPPVSEEGITNTKESKDL